MLVRVHGLIELLAHVSFLRLLLLTLPVHLLLIVLRIDISLDIGHYQLVCSFHVTTVVDVFKVYATTVRGAGGICTASTDCATGICTTGTCSPLAVGGVCAVSTTCTSGVCTSGVCVAHGLGGKCGTNSDCTVGQCLTGTCTTSMFAATSLPAFYFSFDGYVIQTDSFNSYSLFIDS